LDRLRTPAPLGTLSPRVVVATDEMVTTYQSYGDEWPVEITGKALYACGRLLAVADTDKVRICDTTRLIVEGAFLCSRTGPTVNGWDVESVAPNRAEPQARLPFTGRQRELDMLHEVFGQVLQRQRPHVVTIVGDAGIGKTRLVEEFLQGIEESEAP